MTKFGKARIVLWTALLIVFSILYFEGREKRPDGDAVREKASADRSGGSARMLKDLNTSSSEEEPPPSESLPEGALANEYLVGFADEASWRRFLEAARLRGIRVLGANDRLRTARVAFGDEAELAWVREAAAREGGSLDFNYVVLTPTDFSYLPSDGSSVAFRGSALKWLGVPTDNGAWGKGVTIAILDTGVARHSALEGASIREIDLVGAGSGGGGVETFDGHGTAVAAIVVAQNGQGLAPAVEVLSVRVLDGQGVGDNFTLAQGIVEAVDRGAKVISMSLGSSGFSAVLEAAVAYAISNGAVLVAAAGNDGAGSLPYPARFDGVIAVAAVDATSQRAPFSNYGSAVDLAAPGVGVVVPWGESEWTGFSGTSASAPFVAASIAALVSLDARLSPADAASLLIQYANDSGAPGKDFETGAGVIDIGRVVDRGTPGIFDAALSGIYLDRNRMTESSAPLVVSVQNRGTERLPAVTLEFSAAGGLSQSINIGALSVGETGSYTAFFRPEDLAVEEGLAIYAKSDLGTIVDGNPSNDSRNVALRIVREE